MRGSPQQRLRQALARPLRHVLVGSLVLTATGVCVAAWLAIALQMTPTPVSAVTIAPALVAVDDAPSNQVASAAAGSSDSTNQTSLALESDRAGSSSASRAVSADPTTMSSRRTNSSAINSEDASSVTTARASVAPPEWRASLVARAAQRDNAQPLVEPMRGLARPLTRAEERDVLVARAAARDNLPPLVEPMRGLMRPPTSAELSAALVAQAAARTDAPDVVESSYPIDANVLQTPELKPGDIVEATISFYYCLQGDTPESGDGGAFCGVMRDGSVVYNGAAACSWAYLGQRFIVIGDPTERVYTCADTGSAVHGLHRDIWSYTAEEGWRWQLSVGTTAFLRIVD